MKNDRSTANTLTRRRMLARVGLAAGAAYMAPAMVGLNAAHASGNSGGSRGSSGPSNSRSSGPSRGRSSGPSRGRSSGASRSRASGPSRYRGRADTETPRWLRRLMQGI